MPPRRISSDRLTRSLSRIALSLLTDQSVEPASPAEGWEKWRLEYGECGSICFTGPSLEELWERHGPELLREWIVAHPGTRPTAFWAWSGPDAHPGSTLASANVPDEADQPAILAAAGLLTADEQRRLRTCT